MDVARISQVQKRLSSELLLIDDPTDLFYLTGCSLSLGKLALSKQSATLFVDGRYLEQAKKIAPCEVKLLSFLGEEIAPFHQIQFDSAHLSYDAFQQMQKKFPKKEWIPHPNPLKQVRLIKEAEEITALKKAADLTWRGYLHLCSLLKEGVSEEELALSFEIFCRKKGASKLSFDPIIAFGENSAYPHYRAGKATLKKDQNVLFDLGAVVDGYAGDMTRVVFFGRPDPQLEKDYQLIQKAQKAAMKAVRPGTAFQMLDQIVREIFQKEGVEPLFTHGLSHGIGLDVHEYPSLRKEGGDGALLLVPNMVFTIEPGLYRPGLGGVRYEDTVRVTDSGVENFYASV